MFYKGYRFHITVAGVLLFFIAGFYLQNRYLKHQLLELERVHWLLFSRVADHNFEELILNLDDHISPEDMFNSIDSVIFANFSGIYSPNDMIILFLNEKNELLHGYNTQRLKKRYSIDDADDFSLVSQIEHPSIGKAKVKVHNFMGKHNNQIHLFFHILWFLLCFVTIGFLVALWEKQRKAQKIRLDVLNNMVHEFKTPLTSVQLISEMIREQGSSLGEDKLNNYAMIIHQESDKMLHQVTQLLHTAYFDNIRIAFRMRYHNLHGLTEFFLSSYLSVFNESDIVVHRSYRAKNPVCSIDRSHYFNILTNLLDNARKYSGGKQAVICISSFNEGNKLFIEITDNGVGIAHKHLKHIFDRFYRVPQGNIREKSGYGVGLYYVKTVLKQMKSNIRVKSKPGQGTTFSISIRNIKT